MNQEIRELHQLLNQSLDTLDKAYDLVIPSGVNEQIESCRLIGMAIGEVLQALKFVHDTAPELTPKEPKFPDPHPTAEQELEISTLTKAQISEIDSTLLTCTSYEFRKVTRIIGSAISLLDHRYAKIPDIFYASRIYDLIRQGQLIHQGDIGFMGHCEVKKPNAAQE